MVQVGGIAIENRTLFQKKSPPARENDQNSPKSTKWPKITFPGSKMVPKVS